MKRLLLLLTVLFGLCGSSLAQEDGKAYFYKLKECIGARTSGENYCVVYFNGSNCTTTRNYCMSRSLIDRDLSKDLYYYEKFLSTGKCLKLKYESKYTYCYDNGYIPGLGFSSYYYDFSSDMQQLEISKISGEGNNYETITFKYDLVGKDDLVDSRYISNLKNEIIYE